jgi:hypothetical protein
MGSKLVPRGKIRLRLDRGTALLKHLGLGNAQCELADISESGCQCRINLEQFPEESREAWRGVLVPGRVLGIEITEPEEMGGITIPEAEIRWVQMQPTEIIFGLNLRGLTAQHAQMLNDSLVRVASKKLRGKKEEPEELKRANKPVTRSVRKSASKRRFETTVKDVTELE